LGEVLCGALEAVRPTDGRVVSNPFGMSILDLALLQRVTQVAQANSAGFLIDLTTDTPAATAWPAAEH